ncbi:MAG: hypothetical protein JSW65_08380 [Candidatus Bipolaricaulota bacterium]|nr:MAG: hypothetical protein JSW65_08380 [Candidatus Bipolaricaulota bacterium]
MDDALRIGIVAGLMTLLLLMGLALRPSEPEAEEPLPVAEVVQEEDCAVIQDLTLEMLDPVYSEKAVFDDGLIRASFDVAQSADGIESGLSLWLHNSTDDAIVVHWDLCSFQLPDSDTVNIVHEDQAGEFAEWLPSTLTLGPGGDLFTTIYPIGDVEMLEGWCGSFGVLTEGPFSFVLAIEGGGTCAERYLVYYPFRFVVR